MTHNEVEIIGKNVKDMYGTFMGKVAGTVTDIDGSIQSVGIDCGARGLQQIEYEQLVVQNDVVIFIPRWRLDSQKLLREKQLTLRRLKALVDIVSENDDMRSDAEIIHEKYRSKLAELDEAERGIAARLEARLDELGEQAKSAKMLVFDAKVQFKSDEISAATFEAVKSCTNDVLAHVRHETDEIGTVRGRIADLELEVRELTIPQGGDDAAAYAAAPHAQQEVQAKLPEAPTEPVAPEPVPAPAPAAFAFPQPPAQEPGGDWLSRMESQ